MLDLGDPVPLSVEIKNAAGFLENAGAVAVTVTLPDGTVATPAVTNVSPGVYTASYPTTQAGRHTVRWLATGANASAYTDAFDVDAAATAIVSLAEVKKHLNIDDTDSDDELRFYMDAATEMVEGMVGPVARRIVTETVTGRDGELILNHAPAISLTTVESTQGWTGTYDTAGMHLDGPSGIVRYGATGLTWSYPVSVTYVAGRVIVPAAIRLATLIILAHMWETQRGGDSPASLLAGGDQDPGFSPGFGFAVPNRAKELLAPYMLAPSVA